MDQQNMRLWLDARFAQAQWEVGVRKDELLRAAEDDDALHRVIELYLADRLYQGPDDVLQAIPQQAWQELQEEAGRQAAVQGVTGVPTHFQEVPVGQDRSDVYRPGEGAPRTPGFGQSAGAQRETGPTG